MQKYCVSVTFLRFPQTVLLLISVVSSAGHLGRTAEATAGPLSADQGLRAIVGATSADGASEVSGSVWKRPLSLSGRDTSVNFVMFSKVLKRY